jgi:hypothetical protein
MKRILRLPASPTDERHTATMLVTSALIPLLAIYWRLRGALRWRVWFM